jgi:hypothetical protein
VRLLAIKTAQRNHRRAQTQRISFSLHTHYIHQNPTSSTKPKCLAVHVTKTNVAVKVVVYSIAETGIVLQVATVTNTNVAVKVVVYSIAETGIMLQVATVSLHCCRSTATVSYSYILYEGAALSNPNTTRAGRRHAKEELRMMVGELHLHHTYNC